MRVVRLNLLVKAWSHRNDMLHAADKLGQEDQQRQEKASRGSRERSVGAARAPLYYMLHLRKVTGFNVAGDLDTYTISHDTRN